MILKTPIEFQPGDIVFQPFSGDRVGQVISEPIDRGVEVIVSFDGSNSGRLPGVIRTGTFSRTQPWPVLPWT